MRRELQQQLYENPLNPWERALIQEGLVPIFPESKLEKATGLRLLKGLILPVASVTALIAVACSGGADKNSSSQELENRESSGYELPFPKGETWFLTGGPHSDGFSNGIRYAIDIAPPEGGSCPTDGSRLVIENRVVSASASGEVIVAGDDKNRSDPSHSMIKIKDANGLTEVYVHAANLKVKKGDKVKQDALLGNPSCEFPPGGRNDGAHIHVGLEKDGQAIPIDGVVIGDWTVHSGETNYNGTVTQGKTVKTADTRRCATDTACGGIRNDLLNEKGSAKLVVGSPKPPTPPISATVTSKEVTGATANPAPKPTETSKPTPTIEKQVEQGWKMVNSLNYPYRIAIPVEWTRDSTNFNGKKVDVFKGEVIDGFQTNINVFFEPAKKWATLNDYVDNYFEEVKKLNPEGLSMAKNIQEEKGKVFIRDSTGGITVTGDGTDIHGNRNSDFPLYTASVIMWYGDEKVANRLSEMSKVKVTGKPTEIVAAFIQKGTIFVNPDLHSIAAITLIDGNVIQITLSVAAHTKENDMLSLLDRFQKMLESFKFLQ